MKLFGRIISGVVLLTLLFLSVPQRAYSAESQNESVFLSKCVEQLENGDFRIRLDSFVTGEVSVSDRPSETDFVLVLDQSGSMADFFTSQISYQDITSEYTNIQLKKMSDKNELFFKTPDGTLKEVKVSGDKRSFSYSIDDIVFMTVNGGNKSVLLVANDITGAGTFVAKISVGDSKLSVLQDSAKQFIDLIEQNAISDNVNHRISVIGFGGADNLKNQEQYKNTEYFNGDVQIKYDSTITDDTLESISKDVKTQKQDLYDSINALDASGATAVDLGMEMADKYLEHSKSVRPDYNRIVIVISDGSPTHSNGFDNNVANDAILNAYSAKNNYGAKIFSVGLFSEANTIADPADSSTSDQDRFMQYLSSDYQKAVSLDNGGEGGDYTSGYYCNATSIPQLELIFSKIAEESQHPFIELNENAVVKDVISQYFELSSVDSIHTYVVNCTGKSVDNYTFDETTKTEVSLTKAVDGQSVDIKGFDFAAEFCCDKEKEDGSFGKKLVVEFDIKPREGFYGGNAVPTNDVITDENGNSISEYKSGLYETSESTEPIKEFETQYADVSLDVPFESKDINIFAGNSFTADDFKCEIGAVGDDFWKDDYIDKAGVVYTFEDEDGKSECDTLNDAVYTVYALVKPLYSPCGTGTANSMEGEIFSSLSSVNVFIPVLTFKDSTIFLGYSADYSDNYLSSENIWKHSETFSSDVQMLGGIPNLSIEYLPSLDEEPNGFYKQDTPVSVACVSNGSVVLYDGADFAYSEFEKDESSLQDNTAQFMVFVKSGELTVTKSGFNKIYGGKKQTFIITIQGENAVNGRYADKVIKKVVITGNNSVVITGLPAGKYTITEDMNWSWRYENSSSSAEISVENPEAEIFAKNTLKKKKWLDSGASVHNVFNAKSTVQEAEE